MKATLVHVILCLLALSIGATASPAFACNSHIIAMLEQGMQIPAYKCGSHLNEATAAASEKKWDVAIKAIRAQMEEWRRQDPDNLELLGYFQSKNGDYNGAKATYQKVLAKTPDRVSTHQLLGELYLAKGDHKLARAELAVVQKNCKPGCYELDQLQHKFKDAKVQEE